MSVFGITDKDPCLPGLCVYNKRWYALLRKYHHNKKHYAANVQITVLHASDDLNVIKQWRDNYYKMYDVFNNPKYIHSRKPTGHKRSQRGKRSHLYGKRIAPKNYRWYTNGFKNIFILMNTQPNGFHLGCIKTPPHNAIINAKSANAKKRRCMGPDSTIYPSVKEAAAANNVSAYCILYRIKHKHGWKYIDKSKRKPNKPFIRKVKPIIDIL